MSKLDKNMAQRTSRPATTRTKAEWRPIAKRPGWQISDWGEAKTKSGQLAKLTPLNDGYLSAAGRRVHLWVAEAFIDNPDKHTVQYGASSGVLKRLMGGGRPAPPLIINYKWQSGGRQRQEIRFYPFIPERHIVHSIREVEAATEKPEMYNYLLADLPFMVLYPKSRKTKRASYEITDDLAEWLNQQCQATGQTKSQIVQQSLRDSRSRTARI